MPSRRLDPDTALEISLNANARRLATDYAPLDTSVAQLRDLAGGRADLLAKAAGQHLGGYLAGPGSSHPAIPYAAALLILAGADATAVPRHTDEVRGIAGSAR